VTDQRVLPVIAEHVPRHRDVVAGVGDVQEAVVEVGVVLDGAGEGVVIDPDVCGVLDLDRVTAGYPADVRF
jgi:hypothetical protein